MTYTRVCKGCGESFTAKRPHALYCSDGCRAREWKDQREKADQRRQERVPGGKPSGLQVSYPKAVEAIMQLLADQAQEPHPSYKWVAEAYMRRALSDRQRAQLHAREEKRRAA